MANMVTFDEVKADRKQREIPGGYAWRTDFFVPPEQTRNAPQAFLAESSPNRLIPTHFHDVDQFQIIVSGGGTLGRHVLAPFAVHFARAYTPYGPIVAGKNGLGFLTIRARRDSDGAQFLPENRTRLEQVPGRQPWQVTQVPDFTDCTDAVTLKTLAEIKDEKGLAAYTLHMKPNARTLAPDPYGSDCQCLVVLKGSLISKGKTHDAIIMSFVTPGEGPLELIAGPQGLEVAVLNFPHLETPIARTNPGSAVADLKTWRCALCAFDYDEAAGMPNEGIAAGTRWEDVPETWSCPDCLASKHDFQMVEV